MTSGVIFVGDNIFGFFLNAIFIIENCSLINAFINDNPIFKVMIF
jgi:hypothetical protein